MKNKLSYLLIPLAILFIWKVFFTVRPDLLRVERRGVSPKGKPLILDKVIAETKEKTLEENIEETKQIEVPVFTNLLTFDKGIVESCSRYIQKFCPRLPPLTPQIVLDKCLFKYMKKIKNKCKKRLKKRLRFYNLVAGPKNPSFLLNCGEDGKKYCKNQMKSEVLFRPCLLSNLSNLNDRCTKFLVDDFKKRRLEAREFTKTILEFQMRSLDKKITKFKKCMPDIKKYCDPKPLMKDISKECLLYNWNIISEDCRKNIIHNFY